MNEETQSATIGKVTKRDGRIVDFDLNKIKAAINKAFLKGKYTGEVVVWPSTDEVQSLDGVNVDLNTITCSVLKKVSQRYATPGVTEISIEEVQDDVIATLKECGYGKVASSYANYRNHRTKVRESKTALSKTLAKISAPGDDDIKRDNANVNGQTSMGAMLMYGQEAAKDYNWKHLLKPEHTLAYLDGYIHIHDFDFYQWTLTCVQTDLLKLFKDGFTTGHGWIREPSSIRSYSSLACIALQSCQCDMHGGQSICNFDYAMAEGIRKTFRKLFYENLSRSILLKTGIDIPAKTIDAYVENVGRGSLKPTMNMDDTYVTQLTRYIRDNTEYSTSDARDLIKQIHDITVKDVDKETYQAMEALVHNLCSMHSRAGSQVPFSSINYGTDTTPEGRMAIKNILLATEAGLGKGETAIFPIHVFREMSGVNYNPEDPNYDMWKLACKVSAKRLFPNFMNIDAPFNKMFYNGTPESIASTIN